MEVILEQALKIRDELCEEYLKAHRLVIFRIEGLVLLLEDSECEEYPSIAILCIVTAFVV